MNALANLMKVLTRPNHDYNAGTERFLRLDLAKMTDEMRIVEAAREHGVAGAPAADSSEFYGLEQNIVTAIENKKAASHEIYLDNMQTYAERIKALDIEGRSSEIRVAALDAIANFRRETAQGLDELHNERTHVVEAEKDLARFRDKHQREQAAHHPNSHLLHTGLLIIIFLAEAVLNGYFLARGSEFGLLGGVTEAVVIATLNVGVGWAMGRLGIPNLARRGAGWKLLGLMFLVAWIGFAVAFNLAVAHYRDALGADLPEVAMRTAWPAFLADPLGIQDFSSWILVGLGGFFSFVAVLDGFFWDDSYPGYGRISRKRTDAVEEYAEMKGDLLDTLEDRKEEAAEALKVARQDIANRRAEFYAIVEARERMHSAYLTHLDYLEEAGNQLLATYRDENRRARGPLSAPTRFQQRWTLNRPLGVATIEPHTMREAIDKEVTSATVELTNAIEGLYAAYTNAIERYEQIQQLTALPS